MNEENKKELTRDDEGLNDEILNVKGRDTVANVTQHSFDTPEHDSSKTEEKALDGETEEAETEDQDMEELAEKIFEGFEDDTAPKKKRGMVKKQKIMIITFASVALVLILAYFIFLLPYMKKQSEEKPVEPPEILEGEFYDAKSETLLIFPQVEKNKIQSVEVHNSYGSFTCVKESDDVFYIKEHMLAPFSGDKMASLAVDAGYTVVSRRITTKCEDFSKYGLSESDSPAYYILTTVSGEKHTVYLGDYTPNGGGIYCRYAGRDALYVISSSVSSTLLVGAEGLITPMLMLPLPNAAYAQTDQVIITKNGQPFVEILYDNMCAKCGGKNKELQSENVYQCEKCGTKTPIDQYKLSAYKMTYPSNHIVNDTNYSTNLLLSLCTLQGQSVLKAGSGAIGERLCDDEAIMAEYGFHDFANVPYRLLYVYGDQSSAVAFAKSGVEGYYFAYAYEFDMIVLVQETTVPYLEWDILDYISSAIFAENITDVSEITVNTAEGSYLSYNGKKYSVNERFTIQYDEGESENLIFCTATRTGKTYNETSPSFNYIQGFYGSMLSMYIEGYADNTNPNTMTKYAEMTVKLNDDAKTEYKYAFYRTGERCFYTINGSGEFYIPMYQLTRMLVNAVRAAEGFPVNDSESAPAIPETYAPVA